MRAPRVLIVGAGAAGVAAVAELRRCGFDGTLTILHGEAGLPYNRTTVSTTLLQPTSDPAAVEYSVRQVIPDDADTRLIRGSARSLDVLRRTVELDNGRQLPYDRLLVSTGAGPRRLGVPVAEEVRSKVVALHSAADAAAVRQELAALRVNLERRPRVLIVGAGLLGSEIACSLTEQDVDAMLLDPAPTPLGPLLGSVVGGWVRDQQRSSTGGLTCDTVVEIRSAPAHSALSVLLASGTVVVVDLVISAIGAQAQVDWLAQGPGDLGGALVAGGVVTDDRFRSTSGHHVYAAGDAARSAGAPTGHWGEAARQGAHAGRTIAHDLGLAEDPGSYTSHPSWATRLHGRPITVVGSIAAGTDLVELEDKSTGTMVTASFATGGPLTGIAVVGPPKVANKLRPLVVARSTSAQLVETAAMLGLSATLPRGSRRDATSLSGDTDPVPQVPSTAPPRRRPGRTRWLRRAAAS